VRIVVVAGFSCYLGFWILTGFRLVGGWIGLLSVNATIASAKTYRSSYLFIYLWHAFRRKSLSEKSHCALELSILAQAP
jgi:hypothetical protein